MSARQRARTTRIGRPLSLVVVSLVLAALLLLLLEPADATLGSPPCGAAGPVGSAEAEPPAEGEPSGEGGEEAPETETETETAEEPPTPEPPIEEVVEEEPAAEAAGSGSAETAKAPGGCEAASPPPASCLLRSARARVFVDATKDRARLLLDYSTFVATRATVEYRLSAARGSLLLGRAKRMLAARGVVRIGGRLTRSRMAKLRATQDLAVDLHIPAAPPSCHRYHTLHLTTRHDSRSKIVWSQAR